MEQRESIVRRTYEFLQSFGLKLSSDSDINDLRILEQVPAIAVVGLVSRGKSTLVNKLIGIDLLPTGPNPVTFGNGFLTTGSPRAVGHVKKGSPIDLPLSIDEFRIRARRHEQQDLTDFEYSGNLRIPPGVMLIDTKGLDEVSKKFRDDIVELEKSWARQGAMAALLVTSVPPGASAQDVLLHQTLMEHFSGNVLVVVKQTDSTLTEQDLRDAASVWRGHGASVIVVGDQSPMSDDSWGTGPLAELESRLSEFWARSGQSRNQALSRLESSLETLAQSIPLLDPKSRKMKTQRDALWSCLTDRLVMTAVHSEAKSRLNEQYATDSTPLRDVESFETALQYALIGSDVALSRLLDGTKRVSQFRKVVPLSVQAERLYALAPSLGRSVFSSCTIEDDDELLAISNLIDDLETRGERTAVLRTACENYVTRIQDEKRLCRIMIEGGKCVYLLALQSGVSQWMSLVESGRDVNGSIPELVKAFQSRTEQIFENSGALSGQVGDILDCLRSELDSWGNAEVARHSEIFGPLTHHSFVYNKPINPFDTLRERLAKLRRIAERLQVAAPFTDEDTQERISILSKELAIDGRRYRWTHSVHELVSDDLDNRVSLTNLYKWLAIASGVLAFVFLVNGSIVSVILGALVCHFALRMFKISARGLGVVESYERADELRPVTHHYRRQMLSSVAFIAVVIGSVVTLDNLRSNDNTESVFEETVSTEANEILPVDTLVVVTQVTEAPITTAQRPLIVSSDDLIDDLIQDGRGTRLEEVEISTVSSLDVSYAFRLLDKWADLPSELSITYCWNNRMMGTTDCGDSTAIRFRQVADDVIYGAATSLSNLTVPGTYELQIEMDGVEGRFTSVSTVSVLGEPLDTTTTVSLPYRYDRSQYWNANCPKLLRKNELLPLSLCDQGRGVRRVQKLLGLNVDGSYGNNTHNAVVDFQYENGLVPTGVVDRETWYKLDPAQLGPGFDRNGDGLVTPDEFG